MAETLRIFVGGLPQDVDLSDITQRLQKYGTVLSGEIKKKTDATGEWLKTFCYVNMTMDDKSFAKCKSSLNNTIWKGSRLTIQLAKQDATAKYAEERLANSQGADQKSNRITGGGEEKPRPPTEIKGAVPGTPVPDNENWVVTRYQRVVPVMKVRSRDKKKLIQYDPSKHSHQLKNLERQVDKEPAVDTNVSDLTWSLESDNARIYEYKKRIGDFTEFSSPKKVKTPGRTADEVIAEAKRARELDSDFEIVPSINIPSARSSSSEDSATKVKQNLSRFDSDSDDSDDIISPTTFKNSKSEVLTPKSNGKQEEILNDMVRSPPASKKRKPAQSNSNSVSKDVTLRKKVKKSAGLDSVGDERRNSSHVVKNVTESPKQDLSRSDSDSQEADEDSISHKVNGRIKSANLTIEKSNLNGDTHVEPSMVSTKKSTVNNTSSDTVVTSPSKTSKNSRRIVPTSAKTPQTKSSRKDTDSDTSDDSSSSESSSRENEKAHPSKGSTKSNQFKNSQEDVDGRIKPENRNKSNLPSKKSSRNFLTSAEKHALSNKKRLEAMVARQEFMRKQQSIIKDSLKNMDSKSNKIVFDSDSADSESETGKTKTSRTKIQSANGASSKVLFDSSDEEENDNTDYDDMFAIKPQFEGDKGVKLLKLQQTYKDDDRFKLTDKFMESDTSEDDDDRNEVGRGTKPLGQVHSSHEHEEDDVDQERLRNLEILQSLVGSDKVRINHPTTAKDKDKKIADTSSSVFRSLSTLRFDPTDEKSARFVQESAKKPGETVSKKKKKKLEGADPVATSEPAPEVTKDRFYEVAIDSNQFKSNDGLKFNFIKKDSSEERPNDEKSGIVFDFLKENNQEPNEDGNEDEMNSDHDDNDIDNDDDTRENMDRTYASQPRDKHVSSDDSSDDSNDDSNVINVTNGTKRSTTNSVVCNDDGAPLNTVVDWLFFKLDDPRLIDGAGRFSKATTDERLLKSWKQIRPKLVEDYMMKSKKFSKKLRTKKTSKIQKRFSSKSKVTDQKT